MYILAHSEAKVRRRELRGGTKSKVSKAYRATRSHKQLHCGCPYAEPRELQEDAVADRDQLDHNEIAAVADKAGTSWVCRL